MPIAQYFQGQVVRATWTTVDETQTPPVPIDPGTVMVRYGPLTNPPTLGTSLVYTGASAPATGIVSRSETGSYEARLDSTNFAPGVWELAVVDPAGGAAQDYQPIQFLVRAAPV